SLEQDLVQDVGRAGCRQIESAAQCLNDRAAGAGSEARADALTRASATTAATTSTAATGRRSPAGSAHPASGGGLRTEQPSNDGDRHNSNGEEGDAGAVIVLVLLRLAGGRTRVARR